MVWPNIPWRYAEIYTYDYFALASFALLYYDYALTFADEVEYFWGRKFNIVTVLFFLCRYLSVAGNFPVASQYFMRLTLKSCTKLQKYYQAILIMIQVSIAALLAIRTYAMYNGSRKILITLVTAIAIGVGVGIWSVSGSATDSPSVLGCHHMMTRREATQISIIWIALLLYDSLIFSLTLYKALAMYKHGKSPLLHILVRDGTAYYLVMATANLSNVLTFMFAAPILKGMATVFTNVISSVMVSHLMINIQASATHVHDDTYVSSELGTISAFEAAFGRTGPNTFQSKLSFMDVEMWSTTSNTS